jgi:hypothetical protein
MSQQSFHQQTATGADINFTITTFSSDEIKVYVDGVLKSAGSDYNINPYSSTGQSTVDWIGTAPSSPSVVRIVRQTDVLNNGNTAVEGRATFQAGSSVKADDLNNNTKQALRALQEQQDQKIQSYDFEAQAVNTAAIKDSAVTTGKIADGAIVDADINASADIAVSKLANGTARQLLQTNAGGNGVEFTSNVDVPGTLDVTNAATFDSTVTIAGAVNVNNTTTLDNTTVDGVLDVNGSATIDNITINGNDISSSSHLNLDASNVNVKGPLNVFPNGTHIKFKVEDTAVTTYVNINPLLSNQYDLGASNKKFKDLYIDGTGYIDTVSAGDITGSAVVTSGTSSSDTQVYSAKRAEERFYGKNTLSEIIAPGPNGETWVSDDSKVATTAAIDARIIDLVDDVGGFVPIANETSFPNANPDVNNGAGTLVSVASLSSNLTSNGIGVISISNGTVGNSTVTITGAGNNKTFTAGFGILVETTSTLNTYTFHRYVPNATSVTTVASNLTNIDNVGNNIANVNNVGNNINNVVLAGLNVVNINSVVSNASNINTVAGNDANITTVAGINGDVTTVAGNNSNVTIVANNNANITAVANKDAELGRLGTADAVADMALLGTADAVADMNTLGTSSNVTNMDTLASISGNIATVAGISSNVTTVANDSTEIGTLVGNIANVNIVADNNSNVTAVAGNNSNITAVADNATNINAVANNASNINSAVSNASNINSAVSNASNINTVAGISSNVSTVAGISGSVTTVANNNTNVTTVAGANSNISTVAGSIGNVNTTASDIANVNTVAGSISNVNTVGSNITNVTNASNYLNNFLALYLGQLSSDPVSDSLGNSVTEGDLYFNSNTKQLRIYNGSVFQGIAENAVEVAKFATSAFNSLYTASAGSNSIDLGGLSISGAAFSTENIAANRVSLAKGSGTFNLGGI